MGRLGLQVGPHFWNGWSFAIGGRIEAIPVHDAFGSSTGRRRPGYMLSLEPSVTWTRGAYSFTLGVPVAVERNRDTARFSRVQHQPISAALISGAMTGKAWRAMRQVQGKYQT